MSKKMKTTTTLGRPGESTSPPPDRDLRRLRCAPILESTPSVLVWCVAIMIGPSTTEWREERKRDDTIGDRWPDAARASCAKPAVVVVVVVIVVVVDGSGKHTPPPRHRQGARVHR